MLDGDNGPTVAGVTASDNVDRASHPVAVEVAPLEDDAMDTTPDTELAPVIPSNEDGAQATGRATSEPAQAAPESNEAAAAVVNVDDATQTGNASAIVTSIPSSDSVDAMPEQPPPPPPPVDAVQSDTDSSDEEDDGTPRWHPIQEDHSSPSESELKAIEASTEHSGLDHEYWESQAFLPLKQPEYTAGETGRIDWKIDAYNGTREKPNKDIVMKSEPVTVGGHQWQIKFYPKGNDSDYLSVYLECLSVMKESDSKDDASRMDISEEIKTEEKEEDAMVVTETAPTAELSPPSPIDPQHAPLPLWGSKTVPKRNSVAAQVSVVLYNPTEPRVNYSRTALHRFCTGSPDWGWTRFHGPYYDISQRMPDQRQALLRDDKLAFTAYIRVVNDETNCLWEHPSRDNPWDSFAMTGLQGLKLDSCQHSPSGNLISIISSWMLFKPFRSLLYKFPIPDRKDAPFDRLRPLAAALQKTLYVLRTEVEPGAGAVNLDAVVAALKWHGVASQNIEKYDVIELWDILRTVLENELHGTEVAETLQSLFGPKRNHSSGVPSYRVPVVGVETMQTAVEQSPNFTAMGQAMPQLLTVELERQEFDMKDRAYVKLMNKVSLDEHLVVEHIPYTLYGFVVHKQTLQSYLYQPILRPEGPGSKWYRYSDSRDENQVHCLSQKDAVNAHEGVDKSEKVVGNDSVAYIALYVRDDVASDAFKVDPESESWEIPEWIKDEVEDDWSIAHGYSRMSPSTADESTPTAKTDEEQAAEKESEESYECQVIDSQAFLQHEGSGILDIDGPRWQEEHRDAIHKVLLSTNDDATAIRNKLASLFPNVKDSRQVKFWFLTPTNGCQAWPSLVSVRSDVSCGNSASRTGEDLEELLLDSRRIWVHIMDFEKLPELPKKEERKDSKTTQDLPAPTSAEVVQAEASITATSTTPPPPEIPPATEDTLMSDPEDAPPAPIQPTEVLPVLPNSDADAMIEVEAASAPDPPAVDVVIPSSNLADMLAAGAPIGDTEMVGSQEDILFPPPPPPAGFGSEWAQPPPPPARAASPEPTPEEIEIYFFLKFWNAEKQMLESKGAHIARRSARVDETVVTLVGLPLEDKKKIEIFEETDLTATRTLKHRRTFEQLNLSNCPILIVSPPLSEEQRSSVADRAAFADHVAYLNYRAAARNFPNNLTGHFTRNFFSGQFYKGELQKDHFHGSGNLLYHSGAAYTGSFRMSRRHGHGLYTFQNGDTYDGEWVDDQQHGTGTFVEKATGNTYVGGWKNNKRFGEGVTHWKNAEEAEKLCRICWDSAADAAFYDCGHVVACLECARAVQSCPVCRKRVVTAMKLYYVS